MTEQHVIAAALIALGICILASLLGGCENTSYENSRYFYQGSYEH
jgi:hypothetical protein